MCSVPFSRNRAANVLLQLPRFHHNRNGGIWAVNYARNDFGVKAAHITANVASGPRLNQCNIFHLIFLVSLPTLMTCHFGCTEAVQIQ
jgi:hypothetical protein